MKCPEYQQQRLGKKKKKDLLYLFKDNTEMQQNQTKTNTAWDY